MSVKADMSQWISTTTIRLFVGVLTQLIDGTFAPDDPDRFRDLYDSLTKEDVYFILKDFDSNARHSFVLMKRTEMRRDGLRWL